MFRFFILLLACHITFPLSAKLYVFDLGENLENLVQQGAQCLESEGSECETFFQQALTQAKTLKQDSLLAMTYFEICTAIEYHGKEEDRIRYAREGLKLDGKQHPTVTNRLYRELAVAFRRTVVMDSILPAYEKAMYWAKYSKDNSTIAATYIQWAGGYRRLGDVKKSIEILLEGMPYAEASKDPHRINGIIFNLAAAYLSNEDLEKGFEKFGEAAAGFLAAEDSTMYIRAIGNQSMAAIDIGKIDFALEKLPTVIDFLKRDDPNAAVYATAQYAKALMEKGQDEEALEILKKNLKNSQKSNNTFIALLTQKLLSQCHLKLNQPKPALRYAKAVYDKEKAAGFSNGYSTALQQYALSLKANQQFEQAVDIQEELLHVKDTLWSKDKAKEISSLQEYYEAEKRENQIKLLENEVKVSQLQRTLAIFGIIALAIMLGMVYWQFRERAKRAKLEQEKLNEQLAFKQKELTTHALHLAKKNEILIDLKDQIKASQRNESPADLQGILGTINMDLIEEKNWDQFIQHFEQVHVGFNKSLKQRYPGLTNNELRLLSLMKMNLSPKEIASMLNITQQSVKKARYRLRKKLNLSGENTLENLIVEL